MYTNIVYVFIYISFTMNPQNKYIHTYIGLNLTKYGKEMLKTTKC